MKKTTSQIQTMSIDSKWVKCSGEGEWEGMMLLKEDGKRQSLCDPIEGFEFQEGFFYTLEVQIEQIPDDEVPADGSSLKYTLIKILNKKSDTTQIINHQWNLVKIEGKLWSEIDVLKQLRIPQLTISGADKRFYGNDGCNNYFGGLELLDAANLGFGMMAGTKMACENMEASDLFLKILAEAKTYHRKNNTLSLYNADKLEILTFQCEV